MVTIINLIYSFSIFFKLKPFIKSEVRKKTFFFENILNIALISECFIAFYDYYDILDNINTRMNIGWVILLCNICLMYLLVFDNLLRIFR